MLFSDVYVDRLVKQKLINTVKNKRVAHTQLFLGTEGSHVLALAIAYAQYLNCKNRTDSDSCGVCSSCVQYQHIAHPDLHFYFPSASMKDRDKSSDFHAEWREMITENHALFTEQDWYQKIGMENKQGIINVKDTEEIINKASMKPYESEYKVFIIWKVDKLRYDAAPRLLKTLEEPDGKTLFLLVTDKQEQIIDTILSRSQLVKVNNLPTEEIVNVLMTQKKYDAETAQRIAFLAENNLTTAYNYDINDDNESENLNLFLQFMRLAYLLAVSSKNFELAKMESFIKTMENLGREGQKDFLRYAISFIRKCMLWDYDLQKILKYTPEEKESLPKFITYINRSNGMLFYRYFNESVKHIESNVNGKIMFTDLFFKIAERFARTPAK